MKITVFIGSLSGGGAERVVANLSNFLSKNHEITVLTMSDDTPAYNINKSVQKISLIKQEESSNFIFKNIKRLIRLRNYIKSSKADVYLVMLPITINLLLAHRRMIHVPIIISERNDPKTRYDASRWKRWLMKSLYPKADGFVFQTDDAKSYYSDIVGNKGSVIPNAINQEFLRKPFNGLRKKEIVAAGRLVKQKNFTLLIKAFAKISKKHPDYELIIYGDGPQKGKLQRLSKEMGVSEKVKFPGYVNNFGEHISDSSLFVLSSNFEGMPNALMEAMAMGLPCISTDCPAGGPKFLINNKENGLLVPVKNISKLAESMDKILSDQDLADKLGKNAELVKNRLSSDTIYRKWEKYIFKVYIENQL